MAAAPTMAINQLSSDHTFPSHLHLLPLPQRLVSFSPQSFVLSEETSILCIDGAQRSSCPALALNFLHRLQLFFKIQNAARPAVQSLQELPAIRPNDVILIHLNPLFSLGPEGYHLTIGSNQILIEGKEPSGIFYGLQTLFQVATNQTTAPPELKKERGTGEGFFGIPLLETLSRFGGFGAGASQGKKEEEAPKGKAKGFQIFFPCLEIEDFPQYGWRGMLMDSARHFQPKSFILRYLELLAIHKLNRFHWHLTDDQGWRIEIKKYPLLTEHAAWRINQDGSRYGGFYSQEDIKEIISFAKARQIEIIPEIDIPGHSVALLSAYPALGCPHLPPFQVENRWGVFHGVLCVGNEKVFDQLEEIFTEVADLFPSEWIHIGGDECPRDNWKICQKCQQRMKEEGLHEEGDLQTYFIRRIASFLQTKGKKVIGWDEILDSEEAKNQAGGQLPQLPAGTIIQSWRGMGGAYLAAKNGYFSIASPVSVYYLDHLEIGFEQVFAFELELPSLSEEENKLIIGGECNMWTEHAPPEVIDSRVFPRLLAFSQNLWAPGSKGDYLPFLSKVSEHLNWLSFMGVNEKVPEEAYPRNIGKNAIVFSTLPSYGNHLPMAAFDGNKETFFWAAAAPQEHDYITLLLHQYQMVKKISVLTGHPSIPGRDLLSRGILEISKNGRSFTQVAHFSAGLAEYLPEKEILIKAVRIRPVGKLSDWLIVSEFVLE